MWYWMFGVYDHIGFAEVRRWLSWLERWIGHTGDRGTDPVTAITFNCAALLCVDLIYSVIKRQFL